MPTVKIYRVSVTGDNHSYVQWTECEGDTPPRQLIDSTKRSIVFEAQGTDSTTNSISKSSAATIEMIGDGNSDCSGVGNTLYPTTTTTTTTYAPINFTITPTCSPTNISGIVTVSSFSGGNGTYSTVAISDSNGNSYNAPTTNLGGASTYQWTGLTNGTWFVTLRDSLGNHAVKSVVTACGVCSFNGGSVSYSGASSTTTTSTTTTTTTTTTAAPTTTTTAAPTTTTTTAAPTTTTTTAAPTTTTTTAAPTTTTTTAAPTTTTTTAAPTTTTTTASPSISLSISAKDIGSSAFPVITMSVNSGPAESLVSVNSSLCVERVVVSAPTINVGDMLVFSSEQFYAIRGSTEGCPAVANVSNYTYVVNSSSTQFIALTFDSNLFI